MPTQPWDYQPTESAGSQLTQKPLLEGVVEPVELVSNSEK